MTEEHRNPHSTNSDEQMPNEPAQDPATSGIRGGTPGAQDKGPVAGIGGTGGASGAGGVRATGEQSGDLSGIPGSNAESDPFELSDTALRQIYEQARVIAVVGLKDDPSSASYDVARYLQQQGYQIVPVNPRATSVLDQPAYPNLAAIPFPVDVVDIFRRSEAVAPHVEEAITKGARVVWMQLGIRNEAAARQALQAGLEVVMDHCMKQEHRRLMQNNR